MELSWFEILLICFISSVIPLVISVYNGYRINKVNRKVNKNKGKINKINK